MKAVSLVSVILVSVVIFQQYQLIKMIRGNYKHQRASNDVNKPEKVNQTKPTISAKCSLLKCKGDIFISAIVISDIKNREQRDAIRSMWESMKQSMSTCSDLIFYIPYSNNQPKHIYDSLKSEFLEMGDIVRGIQVNMEFFLSFIFLELLKLFSRCATAQYAVLTMDNLFVNLTAIETDVRNDNARNKSSSILCNVIHRKRPNRNPEDFYYISFKDYGQMEFPAHCKREHPIIVSHYAAQEIVKAYKTTGIWFFDVNLFGILPESLHIRRTHYVSGFEVTTVNGTVGA